MMCAADCQSVQAQMAAYSAGELSPAQAQAFEKHCAACALCREEWQAFEHTLELLSCMAQPVPEENLSGEMWCACREHWIDEVEKRRCQAPWRTLVSDLSHWVPQTQQCVSGLQQTRWNWAIASCALIAFSGAWLLNPSAPSADAGHSLAVTPQNNQFATAHAVAHSERAFAEAENHPGPLRFLNPSQSATVDYLPSSRASQAQRVGFQMPYGIYQTQAGRNYSPRGGIIVSPSRSMFHHLQPWREKQRTNQTSVFPLEEQWHLVAK